VLSKHAVYEDKIPGLILLKQSLLEEKVWSHQQSGHKKWGGERLPMSGIMTNNVDELSGGNIKANIMQLFKKYRLGNMAMVILVNYKSSK